MKEKGGSTIDWIRSIDYYGSPISFTYQGEDNYKTLPGGILSLMFAAIFSFYCFIAASSMVKTKKWSLTQQSLIANNEDLQKRINFNEFTNISMGI